MVLRFLKEFFSYLNKDILKSNGGSHLLLGCAIHCMVTAVLFGVMAANLRVWELVIIDFVCFLVAFPCAMALEDYQAKHYSAIRNDKDVYVTVYGHLGFSLISGPLIYLQLVNPWYFVIASILLVILAYKAHANY